ncbi:hypothetical protein ACW9KT_08690 [Hymenobacter sp. HD11105]
MAPNEIATKADVAAVKEDVQVALQQLQNLMRLLGPANYDTFHSIDEVATMAGVNRKTVEKWVKVGKPDRKGKIIHLATLEFSPGFPRIPYAALLAFGQGVGFDLTKLHRATIPT